MSSTNKTSNGLNKWIATDMPAMSDFNSDNEIIDAAITKANNPLSQIGEKQITADRIADGAMGFTSIIGRPSGGAELTPLTSAENGKLYIYGGDNVRLDNWSQGDGYQQLYIGVPDMLAYRGNLANPNTIDRDGIYWLLPTAANVPETEGYTSALMIAYKPQGGVFHEIWIGANIYVREKSGNFWTAWQSLTADRQKCQSGASSARPAAPAGGECYFDSDLGKPIWWNAGAACWVDSSGSEV